MSEEDWTTDLTGLADENGFNFETLKKSVSISRIRPIRGPILSNVPFQVSTSPTLPIQAPVLYRFRNMLNLDVRATRQIRTGAGHFQNAVIGTGR